MQSCPKAAFSCVLLHKINLITSACLRTWITMYKELTMGENGEDITYNLVNDTNGLYLTTTDTVDVNKLLLLTLGEKRKDTVSVVFLTIVYTIIFITGVVGNVSTCIVIWRNTYMHTVTNYYLFNLAVSDLLTLFLGKYKVLRGLTIIIFCDINRSNEDVY